jgi:23S rRNA pseudouridine2457 synthase
LQSIAQQLVTNNSLRLKSRYIILYKPYDVLSQFSPELEGQRTLAEFGLPKDLYAAGRLDSDSEGLLLLTNDGPLIKRLLEPGQHERTYWAQVEGTPNDEALAKLKQGVLIQGDRTLPARVKLLTEEPPLPQRDPPIRVRKLIPTSWLELALKEGKNRQVRRMTAAVGFPTLRLVRVGIGKIALGALQPGEWRELGSDESDAFRLSL